MPRDPSQCQGRIRVIGYCERKPTIVRDGKPYCWQHDPERLAAKASEARAERLARYQAEEAAAEAKFNRSHLERQSGIRDLSDQDLERIIAAGGIRRILKKIQDDPLTRD